MYDFVIIDPHSPEKVRSSFYWLPYLLYSSLVGNGHTVKLLEDFRLIDTIPTGKRYLINISSTYQEDFGKTFFFLTGKEFECFGYRPFIRRQGYKLFEYSDKMLRLGMLECPKHMYKFKSILWSDGDGHLKRHAGRAYPLFTSFGCRNNCSFCPVWVTCGRKLISLDLHECKRLLHTCVDREIAFIHFADEDFFSDVDRAFMILRLCAKKYLRFIVLGSIDSVSAFISKYGKQILEDAGVKIIELGLETVSDTLLTDMKKKRNLPPEELHARLSGIDLFWLTLTFFPGETVRTLNETGNFLSTFGFKLEELYERIQTNSTRGGLGQFFTPYFGTPAYSLAKKDGVFLMDNSFRLVPSYLPESFLNCDFHVERPRHYSDDIWFALYGLRYNEYSLNDASVRAFISVEDGIRNFFAIQKKAVYLALCARLGIIK